MIIIKDVPGLDTRELLDALLDITPPGQDITTGHGGFVVDEDTAEQFLSAYLIAAGKRPAPTTSAEPASTEPAGPPARPTTRRGAGRRKEA